jgi:hypothetical protein
MGAQKLGMLAISDKLKIETTISNECKKGIEPLLHHISR